MSELEHLEQSIEETRSRLLGRVDEIQDRLSVKNLVRGVAGAPLSVQGDGRGADLFATILRRHPVPLFLAAAGIGWLAYRLNTIVGRTAPPDTIEVVPVNTGHDRVYVDDLERPITPVSLERSRSAAAEA